MQINGKQIFVVRNTSFNQKIQNKGTKIQLVSMMVQKGG